MYRPQHLQADILSQRISPLCHQSKLSQNGLLPLIVKKTNIKSLISITRFLVLDDVCEIPVGLHHFVCLWSHDFPVFSFQWSIKPPFLTLCYWVDYTLQKRNQIKVNRPFFLSNFCLEKKMILSKKLSSHRAFDTHSRTCIQPMVFRLAARWQYVFYVEPKNVRRSFRTDG